jgi:hypothetical protein
MISLLTDDTLNDLYLDDKKNIAVSKTRLIAIKQLIQNKLQTFLGEIPINLDEGVDYFGVILDKFVPMEVKIRELTSKILEVQGVIGIENIDYSFNDNKTQANFDFIIQTDAGNLNLSDIALLT